MITREVVVVTGASAGVGRAIAEEFGRRKAAVGLIARGDAGLRAAADEIERPGGTAHAVSADVADFEAVDAAAQEIEQALGPIDVRLPGDPAAVALLWRQGTRSRAFRSRCAASSAIAAARFTPRWSSFPD